jgi:Periplasmic binding protein
LGENRESKPGGTQLKKKSSRFLALGVVSTLALGNFGNSVSAASKAKTTKKTTKPATAKATTTVASTAAPTTAATTPPKAENTASDQGVTKDTIKIVNLSADLSGLVKAGFIQGVPVDSAERVAKRVNYYLDKWNAAGGINGRKFVNELVTWNPVDPRSFDKACQKISLESKPFLVIAPGGGYPADSTPCIAADGNTLFFTPDPVGLDTFARSKGNLFTSAPPAEILAEAGAKAAIELEQIPTGSRIGVLRGNAKFQGDAWDRVKKVLDDKGYKVVFSDPVVSDGVDTATAAANVRLAVPKMQDAGVTVVLHMMNFTSGSAFGPEALKSGFKPRYVMLEVGSGQCTAFSAGQWQAMMDKMTCATSFDQFRVNKQGQIQKDTPFEAQCRKDEETLYGVATSPGIPYGSFTIKDAQGNTFQDDQSYLICGFMAAAKTAFEKAGANLTKASFKSALYAVGEHPVAGISNGKGSFSEKKPWESTQLQFVEFQAADPVAQKTGKVGGFYGRCLTPSGCWRTIPGTWKAIPNP